MKYLIAGLGNIGAEYEFTRHNIGFLVLDRLAEAQRVKFELNRYAEKTECKYKGKNLHLIKPTTYMNLSGKAVAYWLRELKIETDRLLVVVDDVALPFGSLRLRSRGSSAGHNGLKNIEETLGTQNYARLRVGIGSNYLKGRQASYVLSNFEQKEFNQLPEITDKACTMMLSFATNGIEKTMSLYND